MTPRRQLMLLVSGAFFWRAFASILTAIPSEDGVNYLWMAEQFAAMRPELALSEVFPPLFSLLTAPLVALGLDPFRAGQLVGCASGAIALVVIVRICRELVPGSERAAALLVLTAPLPTRFAAELYTEPVFHVFGAAAVLAGLRGRSLECGLWSGVACWLRPEGLLIALGFAAVRPRKVVPLLGGAAALILALGAWRSSVGLGFVPIAKLEFNVGRLVGDATPGVGEFLLHVGRNALQLPWLWIEAFTVTGVLAWLGLRAGGQRRWMPLAITLALGLVVVCLFLARRRFLVAWFFLIVPFAVEALRRLPDRGRDAMLIAALVVNVLLSLHVQDHDRIAERRVGEYLRELVGEGDDVAGDMTRVIYYAGRRPLPPKHFTVDELVERARRPVVRWVVLGSKRDSTSAVVEALASDFEQHDLPDEFREEALRRGILVLRRR